MADFQTGMYSLSNQINPTQEAKAGFDLGKDIQESGYKMQQLGQQTKEATQAFQDRQAVRQAMQQNVDALGNLDKHAAIVQVAQQNPMLAKQIDNQMTKYGVEGAAAHAERMQQFYANTTPESYAQDKQKLIDEGIDEAKQLPDYLPETSRLRGLMTTGGASQQMDLIKNQAQHEFEIRKTAVEKGIDPTQYLPPALFDIYGRNKMGGQGQPSADKNQLPGVNRTVGGEMDLKGLKVGTDELKSRTEQSDYVTAQNNLLAGKNFMSLANKGDPNKLSPNQLSLMAAEVGKMAASKAPTESELAELTPENRLTAQAKWLSRISGKPEAANQGEFVQQMKEYVSDLQQNSAEVMRAHHQQAYEMAQAAGASPKTADRFKNANETKVRSLLGSSKKAPQASSNPQVQAAEAWLNSPAAKSATPEKIQQIKERINQLKGQR